MADSSIGPSALIDANLFIAHLLDEQKHKDAVSKFRDDVKAKRYEVVISFPLLVEIVGALARDRFNSTKEVLISNLIGTNPQQRENYINDFLDEIRKYVNKDAEELATALKSTAGFRIGKPFSVEINEEVLEFMKKYIGKIRHNDDININTLSFTDIFHILTAQKLNCDALITLDKAFESIKEDDLFLKKPNGDLLKIRVYK